MRKYNLLPHLGMKFTRLLLIREMSIKERFDKKARVVLCKCDCGTEKEIRWNDVKTGRAQSCGCYQAQKMPEIYSTHKMSKTTEYRIYNNMISRCYRSNISAYKYYGGRGIFVCDRWRESFENFFEDMGYRPSIELTLDRINNNDGYYKENCRWATKKQQVENQRKPKSKIYSYGGRDMSIKQWSAFTGISVNCLRTRINKLKMNIEEAVTISTKNKKEINKWKKLSLKEHLQQEK